MLSVCDGAKFESGYFSLDGEVLFESGVFLEYKKPDGKIICIDGERIYFVEDDEMVIRHRAKKALSEVANIINQLIEHVGNGNPENELQATIINNVKRELNDHSIINEDWVVLRYRELHIEAHRMGFN